MRPQILSTLPGYGSADLRADTVAGVTVAMVALPLSIAIAIASGAPPATGVVTAVVAGFLVSALGGSKVQIGGPTGAFIVVVAGIVAAYGMDGLILATAMAGVILLVAGLLRAGTLIEHVPEPVVLGFTLGIAAVIATSQLKDLLGLHPPTDPAAFLEKLPVLWQARGDFSWAALGLGVATMGLITLLRRVAPRAPGLIVAVGATSAFAVIAGLPVDSIHSRFGALPRGLPWPVLPEASLARMLQLLPAALTIAFLAGVESLLSALVADRMIGARHRSNAEVLAQGAANLGSALFGGLPATGAIARTATNVRAGGRTPVAGIVHALTVLVIMAVAAPLAGRLAMPALAGLLLITAWNMAEPHRWRGYARMPRADLALLLLTALLTVLVGLTTAIGIGTALGLALRWWRQRHDPPRDSEARWRTPRR